MSSETIRDRILESLQNLPSNATYDDAIERLEAFPESGRKVPERNDSEIREALESPYRISNAGRCGDDHHSFPRIPSFFGSPINIPQQAVGADC